MYKPREYNVDLQKSPKYRWDGMLSDQWAVDAAHKIAHTISDSFPDILKLAFNAAKSIAPLLFNMKIGDQFGYATEMNQWSKYSIGDRNLTIAANLSYEIMGCSSVSMMVPKLGMVHARNLDWPLPIMRKYTTLVHFIGSDAGSFTSVCVPGMVGMISGVAKGRFSAAINQSPNSILDRNLTGWAAPFLLRRVFETCNTFDEAVNMLGESKVITPAFIHITGIENHESAVIELKTTNSNNIYYINGEPLVITNHFIADDNPGVYDDEQCSQIRSDTLFESAVKCKAKTLSGVANILQKYPVMNIATEQSMVFHPETGNVFLNDCR